MHCLSKEPRQAEELPEVETQERQQKGNGKPLNLEKNKTMHQHTLEKHQLEESSQKTASGAGEKEIKMKPAMCPCTEG